MLSNNPMNLSSMLDQKKADQKAADPLQNQECRVCAEPAAGFHFGAFTCEGCKSFFGRTCNNQSVIQECKNNYRCVVDKKNRTSCKACRLRKCLMVGMSKSGSRYGRRSNWFKIHCLMQASSNSNSNTTASTAFPLLHPGREEQDAPPPSSSTTSCSSSPPSPRSPTPPSIASSRFTTLRPTHLEIPCSRPELPRVARTASPVSNEPAPVPDTSSCSPVKIEPPVHPLASLYSPLFLHGGFPLYRLPNLFGQLPLLNNPFLLSPMLQKNNPTAQEPTHSPNPSYSPTSSILSPVRSHLELLQEHRDLLARFSSHISSQPPLSHLTPPLSSHSQEYQPDNPRHSQASPPGEETEYLDSAGSSDRSVSPPCHGPIDLSFKITRFLNDRAVSSNTDRSPQHTASITSGGIAFEASTPSPTASAHTTSSDVHQPRGQSSSSYSDSDLVDVEEEDEEVHGNEAVDKEISVTADRNQNNLIFVKGGGSSSAMENPQKHRGVDALDLTVAS